MKHGGVFDPDKIKASIEKLEKESFSEGFWNNRENSEKVMGKLNKLKKRLTPWETLVLQFDDIYELFQIAKEENDESLTNDIEKSLIEMTEKYEQLEVMELLSGKYDSNDAFLTIHSGAGGTEACDWVNMLLRMYSRWAETHSYKVRIIDLMEAEGGVKSVTLQLNGEYAYGNLQGETGVHRLVRISPFDSGARRHTTFASVYCSPVIDDEIEFKIKPDDIRIDTYRASGAGGQHVNKTDSAVRLTHLETGIVVQCQNERSQHKNKAIAMKVLKSRLFEFYSAEKEMEQEKHAQEKKDISWGNQIRSYVFHPYSMVKDHRTKYEVGNIQAVMDGKIDVFIESYLKWNWSGV
jgi:peptide chain release factor 2